MQWPLLRPDSAAAGRWSIRPRFVFVCTLGLVLSIAAGQPAATATRLYGAAHTGGHGAPMVAWPDWLLYSAADRYRAVHNIGGISNVTWLPPSGSEEPLLAFDTGPGMGLVDEATRRATQHHLL